MLVTSPNVSPKTSFYLQPTLLVTIISVTNIFVTNGNILQTDRQTHSHTLSFIDKDIEWYKILWFNWILFWNWINRFIFQRKTNNPYFVN